MFIVDSINFWSLHSDAVFDGLGIPLFITAAIAIIIGYRVRGFDIIPIQQSDKRPVRRRAIDMCFEVFDFDGSESPHTGGDNIITQQEYEVISKMVKDGLANSRARIQELNVEKAKMKIKMTKKLKKSAHNTFFGSLVAIFGLYFIYFLIIPPGIHLLTDVIFLVPLVVIALLFANWRMRAGKLAAAKREKEGVKRTIGLDTYILIKQRLENQRKLR
eukprot:NODE_2621_length_1155_cov_22.585895_g2399_i0.p1 GENE.NODE_2621_length_1155_cov_22.585895_g2399_i0~~NODE_2621_length_1155_cov_22.585895_g2399_i0.p1  ORF type:complete len:217 (-),score=49.66 NODE_2621_length_1155_cov_22.585895_g2399_i0:388-1038(-)